MRSWATAPTSAAPIPRPRAPAVVPTGPSVRQTAADSMADALRYVPGITQHQGEGNRDQFVIRGNSTTADFFNPLIRHVERMIIENRAPYPIERTLLTSGMTLFAVESLYRKETLIETPTMNIAYRPAAESTFWRA